MNTDWRPDLEVWLTPFLAALGHKAQRAMCPAYITGLIGPGDRYCVHHFVSVSVWDSAPHLRLLCSVMLTIWRATSVHG